MKLDLIIFLLKLQKYPYIFIKWFHSIPFHSLHVTLKQDYLNSIHFQSFPFLYFKTSNQDYLIQFHSILFHSFPLLKYISFHSIPFHSFMVIPLYSILFPYELPNEAVGHYYECSYTVIVVILQIYTSLTWLMWVILGVNL